MLVQQPKQNKLSKTFSANPHTVVACHGGRVIVRSPEGVDYKRHVTQVKQLVPDLEPVQLHTQETHQTGASTSTSVPEQSTAQTSQSTAPEPVLVQTITTYGPHHVLGLCHHQSRSHSYDPVSLLP